MGKVQKCLQLIAGNWPLSTSALLLALAASLESRGDAAQVLSWQKVDKCQETQKQNYAELHQPEICPIILILGRRGRVNISMDLERRTPFCVLTTCSKRPFLEISQ